MKSVWFKKFGLLPVGILILAIGLISAAVSPVLAKQPDMAKVLIGFDIQPGPSEEALVHAKGGRVRYTQDLVPAIAATLPAQAREALLRNPNVTAVEPDLAVHAIDVELDNTWGVKHIGAAIPGQPGIATIARFLQIAFVNFL